jgi:hypothetical protein
MIQIFAVFKTSIHRTVALEGYETQKKICGYRAGIDMDEVCGLNNQSSVPVTVI